MKRKMKTVPKLIVAAVALILFTITGLLIVNNLTVTDDNETVLTINGEPVSKAEYLFVMSGLRTGVFSYFAQKYNTDESKGFWEYKFDGEIPADVLGKRTLDALRKIKTEQILMEKNGIMNDITFSGFLKQLKEENERRKAASEQNLPVYGPLRFEEKMYFDYLHSERIQKLKKNLSLNILSLKDEEINAEMEKSVAEINDTAFPLPPDIKEQIRRELINRRYEELISKLADSSIVVFKIKSSALKGLAEY